MRPWVIPFWGSRHPSAVFLQIKGTCFFVEMFDLTGIWDGPSPLGLYSQDLFSNAIPL